MNLQLFLHARNAAGSALVTVLLLLLPLVDMQFSSEIDWNAGDFAAAGTLLFSGGLAGLVGL
jgi:hypothetical protein